MESHCIRIGFALALLAAFSMTEPQTCYSQLEDPYSGLDPPGLTPRLFAPEILSEGDYREYVYVIPPGEMACVFDRHADHGFPQGEIFISRFVDGQWTEPELFEVFREYDSVFLPTVSPDGNRWFFTSDSIPLSTGEEGRIPLFYIERTEDGWTQPEYVGQYIHASATTDGTLFVIVEGRDWSRPAFRALTDGGYSDCRFLEPAEYFTENDGHLVVDPQGTYVIFDSQSRPRIGECRLFVSFRTDAGTWTRPASMGRYIEHRAALAWISSDGKYIFYRAGDDVYWVSAGIVEKLKPQEAE